MANNLADSVTPENARMLATKIEVAQQVTSRIEAKCQQGVSGDAAADSCLISGAPGAANCDHDSPW